MAIRTPLSGRRRGLHLDRQAALEALERRELLAGYSTPEDTPLLIADPAAVLAVIQVPPEHGTVIRVGTDGNAGATTATAGFKYTPALNYNGPDGFVYRAGDSTTTPSVSISIDVTPVNDPPEAKNDAYLAQQNTPLVTAAPGVLKNDTDVDGNSLTAKVVTQPARGTVTLLDNGSFTYVPAPDFAGLDSFTYQANDGKATSNVATVGIYVASAAAPPVARPETYGTPKNTVLSATAPGVLGNDTGVNGRPLTASVERVPANGSVDLKPDGSFTYTPKTDYVGYDSFVYRATDVSPAANPTLPAGTTNPLPPASSLATVTIFVGATSPIVVANFDTFTTPMNTALDVAPPGVLKNDYVTPFDPTLGPSANSPPLNVALTAAVLAQPSNGTVTLQPDGSFHYTPNKDFFGTDAFTYRASLVSAPPPGTTSTASDSTPQARDVATVTIYVKPPNPPGPVANNDNFTTAENNNLDVPAPGVLANDYVRPLDLLLAVNVNAPTRVPLTAAIVDKPTHGTLDLKPDGSFHYVPNADFIGADTFTYQASTVSTSTTTNTDPNAVIASPILSNIATVTIRVVPALAHNDLYTTPQDTPLNVAAPGVLANDAGGSNTNPLTANLLSKPVHGTVVLNTDGSFLYTPEAGFSGPDVFTYRATAGTTTSGGTAASTLAVADSGASSPGDANPTLPIKPPEGDVGLVRIYVRPPSTTVEAHDDKYPTPENVPLTVSAPGVLANDVGPAGVSLKATLVDKPANGTLTFNPDGSFTYTPNPDFVGADKFTYRVSDSTATTPTNVNGASTGDTPDHSLATVTIYVLSPNPLPRFILGSNQQATDESGLQKIADWATFVAVSGIGQPTFKVSTDQPQLFATQPTIDATGQLIYAPAPNVSGTATVTVMLTAEGESADTSTAQVFTIDIDKPHPLYNAHLPCDVNGDDICSPADALEVINYVNAYSSTSAIATESELGLFLYLDVNKDGYISPIDALIIINFINAVLGQGGVGEGESAAATDPALLALLAQDMAEGTLGRRRMG